MNRQLVHRLRGAFRWQPMHDEHLLAGADEESRQALGVTDSVLTQLKTQVAVLCPDLAHEAQLGSSRRP